MRICTRSIRSTFPGYTWCNSSVTLYREKLSPAWWLVLALFLFVPTSILLFFPLSILVGAITGVVLWLASVGLLWWLSPVVQLTDREFSAGRSRIEHRHIESIQAISNDESRAEKSTRLDARAWLVLRPWIGPAVKLTVADPEDPTPYWLVSTRRPDLLVEAWEKARA